MKTALKPAGVLALALLLLTFAGCVKLKQAWIINPDGSGKVTVTIAVSESVLNQDNMPDPFADLDNPAGLMGGPVDGWVAFTKPQIVTQGGFKTATFTAYFEDINRVSYRADGGLGRMRRTEFKFSEGSITASDTMVGQVIDTVSLDPEMADAGYRAALKPNLEGLEMVETYTFPGEVTDAEGYDTDGRNASATINTESLTTAYPPNIEGLDDHKVVFTFTPEGWPAGGEAAWKDELAQAKADWLKLREESLESVDASQ